MRKDDIIKLRTETHGRRHESDDCMNTMKLIILDNESMKYKIDAW